MERNKHEHLSFPNLMSTSNAAEISSLNNQNIASEFFGDVRSALNRAITL